MKKELSKKQVWLCCWKWFDFYARTGKHVRIKGPYTFNPVTSLGLCNVIVDFGWLKLISLKTEAECMERIDLRCFVLGKLGYIVDRNRKGALIRANLAKRFYEEEINCG